MQVIKTGELLFCKSDLQVLDCHHGSGVTYFPSYWVETTKKRDWIEPVPFLMT